MTVYDPVEATSPYDINLVLRKTCFIRDVMEKYYSTHNPKVLQRRLWLVKLAVTMEMFTQTTKFTSGTWAI